MMGKIKGRRKRGQKKMTMVGWQLLFNGHELSKCQETVKDQEAWNATVHRVTKSQT